MIEQVRIKVASESFEFSKHAVDQMIIRKILVIEVREAIEVAEIIEDYPDDKYGPSCLLYGKTKSGRSLHIQCSYPSRPLLKIITVYEPDPDLWDNMRYRRA